MDGLLIDSMDEIDIDATYNEENNELGATAHFSRD